MKNKRERPIADPARPEVAAGDALAIEWWPIDRPKPYARNPRKHSARSIEKIAALLQEFGWRQPIVVDAEGVICLGHGRLEAARMSGMTQVPVHVAVNLTAAQIKQLRIADNRVSEESTWDEALLETEIGELLADAGDLKFTAFDTDELLPFLPGWKNLGEEKKAKSGDAPPDNLQMSWGVIIQCQNEDQQAELLERFLGEGLDVRALMG